MGDIAANIYMHMIGVFLINFYTDSLGISAAAAGMVSMASRIFDALNDFVVGYAADKKGNYKKWVFYGSFFSAILFVLMFISPNWSSAAKIVYALVSFSLWTIAYTVYVIPYNAMAATVASTDSERTSLNSVRFIISTIPILLATVLTPIMLNRFEEIWSQSTAYLMTMSAFALLALLSTLVCVAKVKQRFSYAEQKTTKPSFIQIVDALRKNKLLLILCTAFMTRNLGYYVFNGAIVYFFKYYLLNNELMSLFMLVMVIFSVVGMLLVPKAADKYGSKQVFVWTGIIMSLAVALIYFNPDNLLWLFVFGALAAAFMTGPLILSFSLVPKTTEYAIRNNQVDTSALNFSIFIFAQKAGISLASLLIGLTLGASGYVANVVQTTGALNGILLLFTLIPAVITVVMSMVMTLWNVEEL